MTRYDFRNRRCLVTGASSGLGHAIALALVARGARVLATGRSPERLEGWREAALHLGAPNDCALTLAADLTDGHARRRLVEAAGEHFGSALDLLVQSAGVGAYGRFLSHSPETMRRLFEINVFAVAELARESHALLCAGNDATMAVIGSIVARRGLPGRPEYSSSKFAVAGLVESLRAEWSYNRIHISLINPGFTRTEFENNLLIDTAYIKSASRRTQSPEHVARAVLSAVAKRKNEVVAANLRERTLLAVNRVAPWIVDRGLARWTRNLYRRHGV